jgi:L-2-hydroxyglutarate oxidase LhgO
VIVHTVVKSSIAIIGGGIVGLNIALELSNRGIGDVFLLEKEEYLGHHTSTRNSEVIHAGLAYPEGSLKLKLCLEGNKLTYEMLKWLGVSHRADGKWIVAYADDEVKALGRMLAHIRRCGVSGVEEVNPRKVTAVSPLLATPKAAAFSSTTGIMDASSYVSALSRCLSMRDGVFLVYPCAVVEVDMAKKVLRTRERGDMSFDIVINSAGLFADDVYRMCGGARDLEIRPFKGEYYSWRGASLDGLIYPVPRSFFSGADATKTSNFGIHLHRTIGGDVMLGPSQVEVSDREDYTINTGPEAFIEEVSCMLRTRPSPDDLSPALAGNRPKLFEGGRAKADFEIIREGDAIHLLGIESPGLTSAPAIARHVSAMI